MKYAALITALLMSACLAACMEKHVCPVWFVAEEVDSGTAQRVTVELEKALEANQDFRFADSEASSDATFILKRASLVDRSSNEIELTYEVRGQSPQTTIRRAVNCGVHGDVCMAAALKDLKAQCVPGA